MTCTFFGHRDIELIENKGVDTFYVGNNGNFDKIVCSVLSELYSIYPIRFYVVLSYFPKKETDNSEYTVLPEGIEGVPPRFAISYRNKRMIEHSDYVVTYVTRSWGGAAQFKELSKKKRKTVINIL